VFGAKWRSIRAEFSDWHHAYLRFHRWTVRGVLGQDLCPSGRAGRATTGVCLHRRDDRACTSKKKHPRHGEIRHQQRYGLSLRSIRGIANSTEALSRSHGGFSTKIVGICDAAGRLVDFLLTPGQAHELAPSLTLLRPLPKCLDEIFSSLFRRLQKERFSLRFKIV
jgi:hypothetical protein